jgi:hypothetical protein
MNGSRPGWLRIGHVRVDTRVGKDVGDSVMASDLYGAVEKGSALVGRRELELGQEGLELGPVTGLDGFEQSELTKCCRFGDGWRYP